MENWKVTLIIVPCIIVVLCLVGVIIGKIMVRRDSGEERHSLFTLREKLVYSGCILAGIACILLGIFAAPQVSSTGSDMLEGMGPEDGYYGEGEFWGDDGFGEGEAPFDNPGDEALDGDFDNGEAPEGDATDDAADEDKATPGADTAADGTDTALVEIVDAG